MRSILAALMLSASALPALAFDIHDMTEEDREAFGEAVRAYLMEEPEVLVEAITALEQRRLADEATNDIALVAANRDAIFSDEHSWVGGNPDGDMTIVEFLDYRCVVCRNVSAELEKTVEEDGNIRLIFKEFPILGQESDLASRFAIAVKQIAGDDTYKEVHDALMVMRQRVTAESLATIAEKLDLDADEIFNLMHTEDVNAVLRANHQLAERMGVMGTPTFVIDDNMLRGAPPEGMEAAIAALRAGEDLPEGEVEESIPEDQQG